MYGEWVHVQEYAAPPEIDPGKAKRRLAEAVEVIGAVLETPPQRVVLKERRRQRGAAQYERRGDAGRHLEVSEDDLTYLVDLNTYLDTGFFIDQRLTRRLVRRLAGGRRFLNLFSYTGTMTVNALAGGSPASTTVDLSATYLTWAERNLAANGFAAGERGVAAGLGQAGRLIRDGAGPGRAASGPHTLVQADCLRWVAEAGGAYDLIWLDPPTFSNSKKMGRATFDVQRDHADLIRMTARRLLAPGGILLFATNLRNFRLDRTELGGLARQGPLARDPRLRLRTRRQPAPRVPDRAPRRLSALPASQAHRAGTARDLCRDEPCRAQHRRGRGLRQRDRATAPAVRVALRRALRTMPAAGTSPAARATGGAAGRQTRRASSCEGMR